MTWTGDINLATSTTIATTGNLTRPGDHQRQQRPDQSRRQHAPSPGRRQLHRRHYRTVGNLTLNTPVGQILNTSGVTLNVNPVAPTTFALTLDNTVLGTSPINMVGRLMSGANPANVNLNGATLAILGDSLSGALTNETLGTVTLNSGASFISSQSGSGTNPRSA